MKAIHLIATTAFALMAAAPMVGHSQTAAPAVSAKGTWTQKTPMITPRSEVALAEVAGKVYVIGGNINATSVPHNEEYDIATGKWRVRYPMPRGLDHMGIAVVDGKVITVGGFVGAGVHRDGQPAVFEYDPAKEFLARARADEVRPRIGRRRGAQWQGLCDRWAPAVRRHCRHQRSL